MKCFLTDKIFIALDYYYYWEFYEEQNFYHADSACLVGVILVGNWCGHVKVSDVFEPELYHRFSRRPEALNARVVG